MPPNQQIALDIETIPTCDEPDFSDPSHWIPFCIALGHRDETGDVDVDVLFREDSTVESEAQLLDRTIDWIAQRTGNADRELVTYNGSSYDFPILKHRAYSIDDTGPERNVTQRLYLLLQTSEHVDLMEDMIDKRGYHVSLDDALDEHDISAEEATWMDKKVTGADMPSMGLELLSDRPDDELRDAVRRYAASDVQPLFELCDKLLNRRRVLE